MFALVTALTTALLVGLCVLLHFEVLNLLGNVLPQPRHHRGVLVVNVLGLLLAHVVEICIFGVGIYLLVIEFGIGEIIGMNDGLFDCIYFSAMVYTTVGFGDLVPEGPLRLLAGTEALTGLALITWSASFTFLLMERVWRR